AFLLVLRLFRESDGAQAVSSLVIGVTLASAGLALALHLVDPPREPMPDPQKNAPPEEKVESRLYYEVAGGRSGRSTFLLAMRARKSARVFSRNRPALFFFWSVLSMHFQLAAVLFIVLALPTAIDASDTEPTIGLFGQYLPQELSAEAWIWFL